MQNEVTYLAERSRLMNLSCLSKIYHIRRLTEEDIDLIMEVGQNNETYFRYHPPMMTKESIIEDLYALPPHKELKDKYFIGFFEKDHLVAIMDLIVNYPVEKTIHIGFFMLHHLYQKKGVGSQIIESCLSYFSTLEFDTVRLAIDKGNPQSEAFWSKNHFVKTGEVRSDGVYTYYPMELKLMNRPKENNHQNE